MAVSRGTFYVSPSMDIKTKDELNNVKIESGLYYCTDEITLTALNALGTEVSETSSRWTILCLSNELADKLKCYTQIWINSSVKPVNMFIRTLKDDTSYSDFSLLITSDSLKSMGILNGNSTPIEFYVQENTPGVKEGTTRVWINTSN